MTAFPGLTGSIDWSEANPDGEPTIVLLHSLGTDRSIWERQSAWLADSGRRVVAIDLPGHGKSTANEGPYSIASLGSDVSSVMETVTGSGSYEVMGISIGGLIAQWLAVNRGDRVSALMACNTGARLGSESSWSERMSAVEAGGMESIRENVVGRFFAPGFDTENPEVFARYNRVFSATDPLGYLGCCGALRDGDLRDRVGEISCPTLVIAGQRDVATPPELSEWLHSQIGGSNLVVIPGAGHVSNLDHPEAFDRAVRGLLESI